MNWFTKLLSSTLGRKLLMALTGLFLILFLVIHLIGNLQLLKDDEGEAFNVYAQVHDQQSPYRDDFVCQLCLHS